jgi:membrane protein
MSPTGFVKWLWQLVLDIFDEYRRDGVGDLAASITFWTLLSIPAAALAMVSAVGAMGPIVGTSAAQDFETEVTGFVERTFNSEALRNAVSDLFESGNAGVIGVASAVALFTLSRGFAGMVRALDKAYGVTEGRRWWHVRLVSIGLGLGTVVVVAAGATLLAVLPSLPGGSLIKVLAAPLTLIALIAWAATMFHVAPHHRTPWRYDVPGAVVTAVGWVLATQGFAVYVRVTNTANQIQSIVGAVLLALTLMYLLSIVMLVGAELNDVIAQRAGVVQDPVRWLERGQRVIAKAEERLARQGERQSAGNHHQASTTDPTTPSADTGP